MFNTLASIYPYEYLAGHSITECWIMFLEYLNQKSIESYYSNPKDKNGNKKTYKQPYQWQVQH